MATKQQFNDCLKQVQKLFVDYGLDTSDIALITDVIKILNMKQSISKTYHFEDE